MKIRVRWGFCAALLSCWCFLCAAQGKPEKTAVPGDVQADLDTARRSFLALSQATAQRTLRFWQTHETARQAS